jgi:hypothetical protein
MDLVGRKLGDGGATARALLVEVGETAAEASGDAGERLAEAARTLGAATDWMLQATANDRNAGATLYLRAFALVLGARHLVRAAAAAGDAGPRAALAAFHLRQMLPQVPALCAAAREGAAPLYALDLAG